MFTVGVQCISNVFEVVLPSNQLCSKSNLASVLTYTKTLGFTICTICKHNGNAVFWNYSIRVAELGICIADFRVRGCRFCPSSCTSALYLCWSATLPRSLGYLLPRVLSPTVACLQYSLVPGPRSVATESIPTAGPTLQNINI